MEIWKAKRVLRITSPIRFFLWLKIAKFNQESDNDKCLNYKHKVQYKVAYSAATKSAALTLFSLSRQL